MPLGCHGAPVHDQWSIQFPLLPLLFFPVAMDSSVGYFLIRFRKFLALIALPVPMLRQFYFDLSGSTFPHVFIAIFTKIGGKGVSGSTFSHVYLTFLLQLW